MNFKSIISIIVVLVIVGVAGLLIAGGFGRNDAQNWQVVQYLNGSISVRDEAGIYPKWFATVWTYPRYVEYRYNDVVGEGENDKESVRVTFNDGGTAQVSSYVRIQTPITKEARIEFHRQFGGNMEHVKAAVKSHMINCMKATAPLMSATENQSARKAEFAQFIEDQMVGGLYKMNRVEKELKDRYDQTGKPITVFGTEIVLGANGLPLIVSPSPLTKDYNIQVTQFSVTDTDYDPETRKQFAAKKESFLAAEQSKAEREKEVQERLMVIEKFERQKAEVEGEANKVKAKAVIEAKQKAEVALQIKQEQETQAKMRQSVAEIKKQEEEALLAAAKLEAERIVAIAEAEQQAIEKAGKLTEIEQYQLDTEVKKTEAVAKYLPQLQMPTIMMGSNGDGNGNGSSTTDNLINIKLMESLGLLDSAKTNQSSVADRVNRPAPKPADK